MKKLLSLLGAIGFTATTGATVVACGETTTKKDVANDVVTQQDYSVATQNLSAATFKEGDLIASLDSHLRGYLNPLLLNLVDGQQSIQAINDDYEIQGITEDAVAQAIKEVEEGAEKAQLTGLTVHTKDNAQHLRGDVQLPPITILTGSSLNEIIADIEPVIVECQDYMPTFQEILDKVNEAIAKSTGELEKLKLGHFTFEVSRGRVNVTGNGIYYGSFSVKLNSLRAIDINSVIINSDNDLGNLGFIKTPTNDQLYAALVAKYGEDYNYDNLEIINIDGTKAQLMGRNKLKGEASVTYKRATFDLANITTKNLGALEDSPTTKAELVAKINEANKGLDLSEDLITVAGKINPSDISVFISAAENSDIVTGVAQIQWSIKQYDLNDIIKTNDLGALALSASTQDIVNRVNELNDTKLQLDRDVAITEIADVPGEIKGRTAIISAVAGNPKYTGSIRLNWQLIADLTPKNVAKAITDLQDEKQLNFKVVAGSTVEVAKTQISAEIKGLLKLKYALPEALAIEYSEFPDEEFLKNPTSPNTPWTATEEAKMTFTFEKDQKVDVTVVWRIYVLAA